MLSNATCLYPSLSEDLDPAEMPNAFCFDVDPIFDPISMSIADDDDEGFDTFDDEDWDDEDWDEDYDEDYEDEWDDDELDADDDE